MKAKVLAVVAALMMVGSFTAKAQIDVYAGYSHLKYGDVSAPGFAIGADYGLNLLSSAPLKLYAGLRFGYNGQSKTEAGVTGKINYLSLDVPVSVAYQIPVGLDLYLIPYAGINGLFYVGGQTTLLGVSVSQFDKDAQGDNAYKRFQFGAQVGLKMLYEHFMLGIEYRPYFTVLNPNSPNDKPNYFALNVGWVF